MNKLKLAQSSAVAATWSIWFTVVITIWAEQAAGLKNFLKNLTGHHWISKSWGVVAVYLIVLIIYYAVNKSDSGARLIRQVTALTVSAILGTLILLAFFIWHAIK